MKKLFVFAVLVTAMSFTSFAVLAQEIKQQGIEAQNESNVCTPLLQFGPFDSVIIDSKKSFKENLDYWLITSDYKTVKDSMNAGLKLGLPIKGIPINLDASFSESEFNEWKSERNEKFRREITSEESLSIITKTASAILVEGYVSCIKTITPGLKSFYTLNGSTILLVFKYNPLGEEGLPLVTSFIVIGAKVVGTSLQRGDRIPYGGIPIVLTRESNEPVTIALGTTLGYAEVFIPRIITAPQPPALVTRLFSSSSNAALIPEARLTLPTGWKVLSGGANVNWQGAGNMLSACYPENERTFYAKSKAHKFKDTATLDIYVIGLYDPKDEWDVKVWSKNSSVAQHPSATLSVADGYVMTGGGAFANWSKHGSLLTSSYPLSSNTWTASSKDHAYAEAVTLTAYAIGIKPRNGSVLPQQIIVANTSGVEQHPSSEVLLPNGYTLVGGGALVNWKGQGNLLTGSFPNSNLRGWQAKSKDHIAYSPASLTAYAIGLKYQIYIIQ